MLNKHQKSVLFGLMTLVLVASIPVAFSSTLGEDWESIKSSLSDSEKSATVAESLSKVNNAHSTYINSFKNAALEVDPQSDTLIENAFDDIVINHNNGDTEMASLNRQIVDKTILKITYLKIEQALEQKDAESLFGWFSVMEKKFKISEKESFVTNYALDEIRESADEIDEYSDIIKSELLGIFKLKTLEELEEAIAAVSENNIFEAKEKVIEGFYYARTLSPAIEVKLGTTAGYEGLMHEMKEAMEIVNSDISSIEMIPKLEHTLDEVEILISEYEGQDISNLGLALSGIKDRLNLVDAEYANAVDNGKIIDQGEYDETIVFLNKAISLFETNEGSFYTLSNSETKTLENNLNQIKFVVDSKGNSSEITILVGKSLNNITSLEEFAGGQIEINIFQYFDEIDRLLDNAKTSYRNGDSEKAFDLVSQAYLDNYEFIEGPLGEIDAELMSKIEIDMRADLRNMIKSGVSADEVDIQIDMILTDLNSAKKVVPEFGSIALLVLFVAITSIIVLSRKSSLLSLNKI